MIERRAPIARSAGAGSGHGPAPLSELRRRIDAVDEQLLALLERRLELAREVGAAKSSEPSPYLNLKPDREAHVLGRVLAHASPESAKLALSLWREIMAAGLAVQGRLTVQVWPDRRSPDWLAQARDRFGAAASYALAESPQAALAAAAAENAVAVLALDPGQPWWAALGERYSGLWVFESLCGPAGDEASLALAVGRIDPAALAAGPALRVTPSEGSAAAGHVLASAGGRRLELTEASITLGAADRGEGWIGRAGQIGCEPAPPA